jgi:hypothetical protein
MKYNYCLRAFLIILFIAFSFCVEIKKPKSKKGKGKKNRGRFRQPGGLYKKTRVYHDAFESSLDLDVLIRFRLAKFNTNVLGNFVKGIMSAFYRRLYFFFKKQEKSNQVLNRHLRCIKKDLGPFFGNNHIVKAFENKFLFGGLYPFRKHRRNFSVFNHKYNFFRRRNKLLRLIRRLKQVSGTFDAIKRFRLRKKKLNSLYKKYYRTGVPRKLLNKYKPRVRSDPREVQKLNSIKSYRRFKTAIFKRNMRRWRKRYSLESQASRIIGRNAKEMIDHANFMTYAYKKIWFYTSFFTRRVISCGIRASNRAGTIQKVFLHYYKRNQRVTCPYKPVDVLTLMLEKYSLRSSFRVIFRELLVKGVKKKLIHKLRWYRIGQAVFTANQCLEKLCPWF